MKITEIKAGDHFVCIKNCAMQHTGSLVYLKGNIYASEFDSCITDEGGDKNHGWPTHEKVKSINDPNTYFEKLEASVVSGMHDEVVIEGKDAAVLGEHFTKAFFKSADQIVQLTEGRKALTPIDTPTPGPWYAVNYGGFINLQTEDKYTNDNLLDEEKCASAIANGRLAAAAPEMAFLIERICAYVAPMQLHDEELARLIYKAGQLLINLKFTQAETHVCTKFVRRPYTTIKECVECGKIQKDNK